MRKKTLANIADYLLWFLILALPLLMLVLSPLGYSIGGGSSGEITLPDMESILSQFGLTTNNVIYNSLNDLFGSEGVLPFFESGSSILLYFTYFVVVEVLHLLIDCIVFIPRIAHKWINKCTLEVQE